MGLNSNLTELFFSQDDMGIYEDYSLNLTLRSTYYTFLLIHLNSINMFKLTWVQ